MATESSFIIDAIGKMITVSASRSMWNSRYRAARLERAVRARGTARELRSLVNHGTIAILQIGSLGELTARA